MWKNRIVTQVVWWNST